MTRQAHTFTDPIDVDDALRRREMLRTAVAEIQAQLANRSRRNPATGEKLTVAQFQDWRSKAIQALTLRNIELRFVKEWLRRAGPHAGDVRPDVRAFAALIDRGIADYAIASSRETPIVALRHVERVLTIAEPMIASDAVGREAIVEEISVAVFCLARACGVLGDRKVVTR